MSVEGAKDISNATTDNDTEGIKCGDLNGDNAEMDVSNSDASHTEGKERTLASMTKESSSVTTSTTASQTQVAEAAASAMAAVAVAAAAKSNNSPSAAGKLARSTILQQPLLSAHSTGSRMVVVSPQDVTRESVKLDIESVKKCLSVRRDAELLMLNETNVPETNSIEKDSVVEDSKDDEEITTSSLSKDESKDEVADDKVNADKDEKNINVLSTPNSCDDQDSHSICTEEQTCSSPGLPIHAQEKTKIKLPTDLLYMARLSDSNNFFIRLILVLASTPEIIRINNNDIKFVAVENTDATAHHEKKKINADQTQKVNVQGEDTNDLSPNNFNFKTQIEIASKMATEFHFKMEENYDALLQLLPSHENNNIHDEEGRVLLDLLPPSVSTTDATASFFRSCTVKKEGKKSETTKQKKSSTLDKASTKNQNGVSFQNEKDYVTQTESGIEVRRSFASTKKNKYLSKLNGNSSNSNSNSNNDIPSSSPSSKAGATAISVANAIVGAAGVVGGMMSGSSLANKASVGSLLRKQPVQLKESKSTSTTNNNNANSQSISQTSSSDSDSDSDSDYTSSKSHAAGHDYTVQISREMLGLTVENVLERTIVRTVLANGAAKKAGAKVGSLIVKVGSVETQNLTHFETIDELRQSQRPLKLVLRRVGKGALQGARSEMSRLIKGVGFGDAGVISERGSENTSSAGNSSNGENDRRNDGFKEVLHTSWMSKLKDIPTHNQEQQQQQQMNQKQFSTAASRKLKLAKIAERLVWILTLLVIGLEREVALAPESDHSPFDHHKQSTKEHYAEAAKSLSKILLDFVTRQFLGSDDGNTDKNISLGNNVIEKNQKKGSLQQQPQSKSQSMPGKSMIKSKNQKHKQTTLTGRLGTTSNTGTKASLRLNSSVGVHHVSEESPLHQIGDVLHRAQSFLSDPFSPPAALLRGEIIALLCDVLDMDTEMELSDVETVSGGGGKEGAINDLGSAGSLLKLIVRHCATMESPGCKRNQPGGSSTSEKAEKNEGNDEDDPTVSSEFNKLYAGNRFLAVVHRLAASRSTSARVTACSLGPVLWGHLDFPHQLQLRGVITRALHDVEVIVRKSTAGVLHEIAELVFDSRAVPWLVLMCERAMTDPEPQLRAAAMTLTWHLAEHLPNAFLGDASKGSRSLSRLPPRTDPTFTEVYLLQCKLLPVATRLAEDRSFSVRLAVAAQCDRLCAALGDHWSSVIIDLLQALLGDADERVRSEATLCLPRLVESVLVGTNPSASSVLESLFPTALKLLKDPSASVRISLATSSGELLTLLVGLGNYEELSTFENPEGGLYKQHKRHVDETLIPLVQRLLHDSDPEVTSSALRAVTNASRGNVKEISSHNAASADDTNTVIGGNGTSMTESPGRLEAKKKPVFIPVLSEEQVLRLLPTLSDLATSPQWRVRQSAVEIVPALLGCTQRLETRSQIAQLCVQLMEDQVDAVRRTAAECLCLGGGSFGGYGDDGGEWVTAIVIPHLQACKENSSAKQRMLCLKMVEAILKNGVCPRNQFSPAPRQGNVLDEGIPPMRSILEIAASLCDDKVVNVRLNIGRVFLEVLHVLDRDNLEFISTTLEEQLEAERSRDNGGDKDVLFFAQRALTKAKQIIATMVGKEASTKR